MEELDNEFIAAVRHPANRRRPKLTPPSIVQFKVNSLGPVHSIIAFLPLLRASNTKKIIVIGSGAGDVKAVQALGTANMAAYGMTKAAAVMAATKFAIMLKDEGFVVVTLAPGMVDTSATAGADGMLTATFWRAVVERCALTCSVYVRRCGGGRLRGVHVLGEELHRNTSYPTDPGSVGRSTAGGHRRAWAVAQWIVSIPLEWGVPSSELSMGL